MCYNEDIQQSAPASCLPHPLEPPALAGGDERQEKMKVKQIFDDLSIISRGPLLTAIRRVRRRKSWRRFGGTTLPSGFDYYAASLAVFASAVTQELDYLECPAADGQHARDALRGWLTFWTTSETAQSIVP